jgi:competence protein ComEC
MKHPLLFVALSYAGGVLLAEYLKLPLSSLFTASFLLLIATLASTRARPWLIWPLVLLTGWTNMVRITIPLNPCDLRSLQGNSPALVTIRGSLADTPSPRTFIRNNQERYRSLAEIKVSHLLEHGKQDWAPAAGRILVTTPGVLSAEYFTGNEVEISGVLAPPPCATAEGLFDYAAYLRRQGIHYQLKTEGTNDWRLIAGRPRAPFSDRFLGWAQRTLARGLPCEDESLRLLWAMSLGWKAGLTNETYEPFMRSGTMHIFAISGLHIALIAGILVGILRVVQVPRGWCGLVAIPLIWFYAGATSWQPSAIRSTIMMTIVISGWAIRRPGNLLNSLAAAAFIILLWDPQQLFGASFQLSFFVVLSIALLLPVLENPIFSYLQPNPLLPPESIPKWWKRTLTVLRWIASLAATSAAAFLGSILLTAHYFHLLSLSSFFANLVVVPMSSAALACNLGSLLLGSWCPWVPELLNHSAWFWMRSSLYVSELLGNAPLGCIPVRGPSFLDFVVYYSCLVGLLSGWALRKDRLRITGPAVALILCTYGWQYYHDMQQTEITVLPFNGAASVYVDSPHAAQRVLFDTGTTNDVVLTGKAFLRSRGMDHVPWLVLTHGDTRHVSGAPLLAAFFPVKNVVASPIQFRSSPYRRSLDVLKKSGATFHELQNNDDFVGWTVLHPEGKDPNTRADDNALVAIASLYGGKILLLSDLSSQGQARLIQRHPELRADILVMEPPANGPPFSERLLDVLRPEAIILCDSGSGSTLNSSDESAVEDHLQRREIQTIHTSTTGAVTVRLSSSGWCIRTMDGQHFQNGKRALIEE